MNRGELIEYVRAQADAVVATIGSGGPEAAYLAITATDDGELVFDARVSSRKIANLRAHPRLAIVIGGRDGTTLQCEGSADFPTGEERARYAASYVAAFPQFAASLDGDDIVLVRVTLDWARFGDFVASPPVVTEVEL